MKDGGGKIAIVSFRFCHLSQISFPLGSSIASIVK